MVNSSTPFLSCSANNAAVGSCKIAATTTLLGIAARSIYPDPTGCATNAKGFVEACAALAGPSTRVLVTYEFRIAEVREALLGAARARFASVRVLPAEELPEGWRTQHVEAFEMRLAPVAAAAEGG